MIEYNDGTEWYDGLQRIWDRQALFDSVIYDDYFDAILGMACVQGVYVLVYSVSNIINNLEGQFTESEDPYTEAVEYFDFHIVGDWNGERTPLHLYDDVDSLLHMYKFIRSCNRPSYYKNLLGEACRCGPPPILVYRTNPPHGTTKLPLPGEQDYALVKLEKLSHASDMPKVRTKAHR